MVTPEHLSSVLLSPTCCQSVCGTPPHYHPRPGSCPDGLLRLRYNEGWRISGGRRRVGRCPEWRQKCGNEELLTALTFLTHTDTHTPWRRVVWRVHVDGGVSVVMWVMGAALSSQAFLCWNVFSSAHCVTAQKFLLRTGEEKDAQFPSKWILHHLPLRARTFTVINTH